MKRVDIDRRGFLKAAGAAAVGLPYLVRSSALGGAGSVAPSNRISMGSIGVGGMGTGDLHGFLSKQEVQVLAVCDVDSGKRESAKNIVDKKYGNTDCATYLDFRELIGRGDLDAVALALPDHWHSIPAIAACRAGLDVHAQKPFARTIREGRAMCRAVERYGIVWQTGSQQRSEGNFHRACELVRNGRIGKVSRVEVGLPTGGGSGNNPVQPVPEGVDWDWWLGPAPWVPYRGVLHWNWRWMMDYSGGQLTDWAGHHIDIAHWGIDTERTGPVEIEGRGEYPKDGIYDVPMTYKLTCKYANGIEMTVANNKQIPQGTKWYGDKGEIYVRRGHLESKPANILNEVIGVDETHLYKSRDHKQNFLDCIKSRKDPIAPAEIAHRSISVALLGEIAMLTEAKLKWDPEKEVFENNDAANRMLGRAMRAPWHL
ncbi:MAG: Gfo/Idh/MocA family oxidoreductase [Sedimentisphaerales bacterium]|nr:Gfo/Idh/MocA family oxidoreductase [Sedimentisphaerales bacterium]